MRQNHAKKKKFNLNGYLSRNSGFFNLCLCDLCLFIGDDVIGVGGDLCVFGFGDRGLFNRFSLFVADFCDLNDRCGRLQGRVSGSDPGKCSVG